MSQDVPAMLSQIRRGEAPDELELLDGAGLIVILHAHGIHDDEKLRTRERALRLLSEVLAR